MPIETLLVFDAEACTQRLRFRVDGVEHHLPAQKVRIRWRWCAVPFVRKGKQLRKDIRGAEVRRVGCTHRRKRKGVAERRPTARVADAQVKARRERRPGAD